LHDDKMRLCLLCVDGFRKELILTTNFLLTSRYNVNIARTEQEGICNINIAILRDPEAPVQCWVNWLLIFSILISIIYCYYYCEQIVTYPYVQFQDQSMVLY
jgi:hypothetical protein